MGVVRRLIGGGESIMSTTPKKTSAQIEIPMRAFTTQSAWARWLDKHHATSPGVWIRLAKKAETRARRIAEFVVMLGGGKTIYP